MKIFMITAIVILFAGAAPAHDHRVSPVMREQHNSMLAMDKEWVLCKKSLAADDLAAAGVALDRMEKALRNLERFKPHLRQEGHLDFQKQARNFKAGLTKLAEAVKGKKSVEVPRLIGKIDDGCLKCHEKFR